MTPEQDLIRRLNGDGVTAGFIMVKLGITHSKAIEWLTKQGARKSNTVVPTMWRIGINATKQTAWGDGSTTAAVRR
jgi:hypothetical protein